MCMSHIFMYQKTGRLFTLLIHCSGQCYLVMCKLASHTPAKFTPADTILVVTYNNETVAQWYQEGLKFIRGLTLYPIAKAKV